MPTVYYTLRIIVPDVIDREMLDELNEQADDRDVTLESKIARYCGGMTNAAEALIADLLPEGWTARIEDDR